MPACPSRRFDRCQEDMGKVCRGPNVFDNLTVAKKIWATCGAAPGALAFFDNLIFGAEVKTLFSRRAGGTRTDSTAMSSQIWPLPKTMRTTCAAPTLSSKISPLPKTARRRRAIQQTSRNAFGRRTAAPAYFEKIDFWQISRVQLFVILKKGTLQQQPTTFGSSKES